MKQKLKVVFGDFWYEYFVRLKNDLTAEYKIWSGVKKSENFFKKLEKPYRLQLGCGPRVMPGWVNTDICQNSNLTVDGILDLRRPFPLKNDSCLEIYSHHVFEHLSYPKSAKHVLRESHRILVPNGKFRVVVPDLDLFLESYHRPEWSSYMEWVLKTKHDEIVFGTRAEIMNFLFRQGGEHQFTYDFKTICELLNVAGFKNIVKSESQSDEISLYVEATK